MKVGVIEFPYYILKVNEHHILKEQLLSHINVSKYEKLPNVSKTDYYLKTKQDYHDLILPILKGIVEETLGQNLFQITGCWFQQYKKFSYHDSHHHACDWAGVYYVELPKGCQGTVFCLGNEKEISPEVEEGELILFPGWVNHRSPVNKSNYSKTIISFNAEKSTTGRVRTYKSNV